MNKIKDRAFKLSKPMRVDNRFRKQIEEIKIDRIKAGKDKKMQSDSRITLGLTRHKNWGNIKEALKLADLPEDEII